ITNALAPDQFKALPFLEQLHKHGPRLGYGAYARHIKRKEIRDPQTNQLTGHAYDIENPETERRILEARKNKRLSHLLAKAYMADNVLQVARAMPGCMRQWTETDAYLTHRFGAKGTIRILSALETRPKTEFAAVVSKSVCTSNPLLCVDRHGRALSVSQVYANLDKKLKNAPSINLD
ncbi:MAG: hypothetical protein HYU57_02285, partial [Micavibrio aeruginosavorus]|nr:hypothetical protein [Micavibrio aeruginosavorus]